jgi:heptosyltransferase-2
MKKILVRAPNWVGDGVMATPAISALRAHFFDAEITLLAKPVVATLFLHHPDIDRIIIYERPGKHAGFIGFLRLAAQLRRERFSLAVLLKNAFESALLTALAGIPKRVGYNTDFRGFLLTGTLQSKTAPVHQREAFLHIVRACAEIDFCHFDEQSEEKSFLEMPELKISRYARNDNPAQVPFLVLTEAEVMVARKQLEWAGIFPLNKGGATPARGLRGLCPPSGDFILGISPGTAKGSAKAWLPDRFAAVADHFVKTHNAKVLILGGPNDLYAGEAVLKEMKSKAFNFIGKLSLREMMAVISLCDLCITNDSGPSHIASAFGIPQVCIYGPRLPAASFPGRSLDAMVYHPVSCSPCDFRICPIDHRCMTGVSVKEVIALANEVVRKRHETWQN